MRGFMPTLTIKIMFCIACMLTGQRLWLGPPKFVDTIAEGIRTQQCGQLTSPILVDYIEKDVFTVVSSSQIKIHLNDSNIFSPRSTLVHHRGIHTYHLISSICLVLD